MRLSVEDLEELRDQALEAAKAAGPFIAKRVGQSLEMERKVGGDSEASQVVTEVDRQAQAIILDTLAESVVKFDLAVLTEEGADDGGRLLKDHFWCIDPLDGTLPFVEGRDGFAVSIALVARSGEALVGVVHDPVAGAIFDAVKGKGARRNGVIFRSIETISGSSELKLCGDRSLEKYNCFSEIICELEKVAEERGLCGVETTLYGGAVMNACWALDSAPACYFKFPKPEAGGGSLWDYAATACLYGEVGGVASDVFGKPLELNRNDSTFMNHRGVVFATDERLAACIRALYTRLRIGN
ncbi:Inositol monophosphatase family [Verrucomicrobiia bacterium DG1235]|nr:Inositol monophosphatase family [Verrucomicrobiae bacterium DG1235]